MNTRRVRQAQNHSSDLPVNTRLEADREAVPCLTLPIRAGSDPILLCHTDGLILIDTVDRAGRGTSIRQPTS